MLVIDKTDAIDGGVYAVVDIVNWEVYIGETGNLKSRADNYRRDLERRSGEVNEKVQKSYDDRHPLFWHVILYDNTVKLKNGEDNYRKLESFYIGLMDEFGFSLYNDKQKAMTIDKVILKYGLDKDVTLLLENSKEALNDDYVRRFGYDIKSLKEMSLEQREHIWIRFLENVKCDIDTKGRHSVYRISDK